MIATIARVLGLHSLVIWGAIALVGAGSLWGYGAWRYSNGYSAGKLAESIAWSDAIHKLRVQQQAERIAAQAEIDRIERDYLARVQADAEAIRDMEQAIAETEAEAAPRPVLPRSVVIQLDRIGR